jgi:hypothetical protein
MCSECSVCCEKFNKSCRMPVVCQCGFEVCRECVKKFLLDQKVDASCMSCKVSWSRKFLLNNLEKVWFNKIYKEYREEVLFERELGMMPATQPYVEREIKIESLKNELLDIEKKLLELYNQKTIATNKLITLRYYDIDKVEKKEFIRQCPNENCRGFLSSSLKCNLCEKWACHDCREVKGDNKDSEHTCKEDILKSVKMMEKDTKPCPKCSAMIFKINGCNVMWCVVCHGFFDWKSGKIHTKELHNPEYLEYVRKNKGENIPRNPQDIQCGRELDENFIRNLPRHKSMISDIIRCTIHIQRIDIRSFTEGEADEKNRPSRIKYMMNKIDKDKLKFILQKNEKETQKKNELVNVLRMYTQCTTDIFYRLTDKNESEILSEMKTLKSYTNDCFYNISKSYNCKTWSISDYYEFI